MNMNLVALQKEIDRITEELRLSGEYADTHFIDVRADLDHIRLEVEAIKRYLAKALPDFGRDFEQVKEEIVQEFDPEFEQERGPEK
jgi:hypothetical protein